MRGSRKKDLAERLLDKVRVASRVPAEPCNPCFEDRLSLILLGLRELEERTWFSGGKLVKPTKVNNLSD